MIQVDLTDVDQGSVQETEITVCKHLRVWKETMMNTITPNLAMML